MQKSSSGYDASRFLANTTSPLVLQFIYTANAMQGCKAPVLVFALRYLIQREVRHA